MVDSELVAKLNNALDKMADLVLAYMDERLLHAVNNLDYDGTGIGNSDLRIGRQHSL